MFIGDNVNYYTKKYRTTHIHFRPLRTDRGPRNLFGCKENILFACYVCHDIQLKFNTLVLLRVNLLALKNKLFFFIP